jgi:hypothetical protein
MVFMIIETNFLWVTQRTNKFSITMKITIFLQTISFMNIIMKVPFR